MAILSNIDVRLGVGLAVLRSVSARGKESQCHQYMCAATWPKRTNGAIILTGLNLWYVRKIIHTIHLNTLLNFPFSSHKLSSSLEHCQPVFEAFFSTILPQASVSIACSLGKVDVSLFRTQLLWLTPVCSEISFTLWLLLYNVIIATTSL